MGTEGSLADDHPSVVILNGLRLEDDQYVFFLLDLWSNIDRNALDGDLLRISRLWGYTLHPSKLPSWLNVQTTCADALQIGLKPKNVTCQRRVSLGSRTRGLSQTVSHPINLRTSHSISHRPTSSERRFNNQSSGRTSCDSERASP